MAIQNGKMGTRLSSINKALIGLKDSQNTEFVKQILENDVKWMMLEMRDLILNHQIPSDWEKTMAQVQEFLTYKLKLRAPDAKFSRHKTTPY